MKTKYLILGGGPAGLAFANRLKDLGENNFLILEQESEAGGLCRSVMVDGSPFDIGGGHFLDVRRPKVNAFLFRFMPEEEWMLFDRNSCIEINGMHIGHPFEANIWQFGRSEQQKYLDSIAKAGCNQGFPMPEKFVDWIRWKLGDKIAEDYMLPYNQKMFADELDELGTYWLEKLPNVSYEETLKSCRTKKPHGTQPGHSRFYYPRKYGYGELWLRLAAAVQNNFLYQSKVIRIDCGKRQVWTLQKNGYEESFQADYIITTIPWAAVQLTGGVPDEITVSIHKLKSSAIETRYVPETFPTCAHWIYIPDMKIPYHRILVRHNFCSGSKGYWLETRKERIGLYADPVGSFTYLNEYAYPLNTIEKPVAMKKILTYCKGQQIYGLGRWGEHCHYNSDAVVERAIKLADQLVKGGT